MQISNMLVIVNLLCKIQIKLAHLHVKKQPTPTQSRITNYMSISDPYCNHMVIYVVNFLGVG